MAGMTESDMREVVRLRAEGLPWHAIGARVGRGKQAVMSVPGRLHALRVARIQLLADLRSPLDAEGLPKKLFWPSVSGGAQAICWHPAADGYLTRRRAEGANCVAIREEMRIDPSTVRGRCADLGLPTPAQQAAANFVRKKRSAGPEPKPPVRGSTAAESREPKCPGHPETWGILTWMSGMPVGRFDGRPGVTLSPDLHAAWQRSVAA